MKKFLTLFLLLASNLIFGAVLNDGDKPQFPMINLVKNAGFENGLTNWSSSYNPIDKDFYTNLGTGFNSTIRTLASQADGKILVGGDFGTLNGIARLRLVRLNVNGTVDTAFYTNLGTGFNGIVYAIAIQPNGKILVGGAFTTLNGVTRNRLIRLNSDGTVDTAFYTNLGSGFNNDIKTIYCDGSTIILGGAFTTLNGITRNRLVQLNSAGTVDAAFYTNLGTGFNNTVNSISYYYSSGKITVTGAFTIFNGNTRNKLVRLQYTGAEDTAFYTNLGTGFNDDIYSNLDISSSINLAGGAFTTLNEITRNRLVKLNNNGSVNTVFATNLGTGFNNPVYAIAAQLDGKILIGGDFTTFNGNTRNKLVRLNSNGTEDTAFYTKFGTGFDNIIYAITVQLDEKILVGGAFTTLNAITRNKLVRLNPDTSKTFTITGTNVAEGKYSLSFETLGGDFFEQSPIFISEGLRNKNCVFGFYYKGGNAALTTKILDSLDNVISSKTLSTQADWTYNYQNFTCPNETIGLKFRIDASSNTDIAYFDNMFIYLRMFTMEP
jgi:uncharacterized delta-60 repeat protein